MKAIVFAAACAAAFLAPLPSQAQSSDTLKLAQRLVVRSGLAEQLNTVPKHLEMELKLARGTVPDDLLAALGEASIESFRPDALREDVVRTLAARMPAEEMKRALAWLEKPQGRRVTQAEEQASRTLSPETLQAYTEALKTAPLSNRRTKYIADLVTATKGVEHAANLTEGVALGIAIGMDRTQSVQNQQGLKALQNRLRSTIPPEKLREELRGTVPEVYAYIYRGVSDADLGAYLAFNRSAAGKRYNDAVMAAFTEAMLRASLRMGPAVEKALQKKPA
jgi:hypothetical protein